MTTAGARRARQGVGAKSHRLQDMGSWRKAEASLLSTDLWLPLKSEAAVDSAPICDNSQQTKSICSPGSESTSLGSKLAWSIPSSWMLRNWTPSTALLTSSIMTTSVPALKAKFQCTALLRSYLVPSYPLAGIIPKLTRHSTEVTQDGPCVIGEDGEVPSVPVGEDKGRHRLREVHTISPQDMDKSPNITLKKALIFPLGIHCRECWCPPCRSALPRGSPSPPLTSSTLAAGRRKGW